MNPSPSRTVLSFTAMLAAAIVVFDGSCEQPPLSGSALSAAPDVLVASEADAVFPFRKILCFGDSITYGVTLQSASSPAARDQLVLTEGYVPKLWRRLEAKYGSGIELVNAGLPGEGSRAAVARIGREMERASPDLVLLLEGVIDVDNDVPDFPLVRDDLREILGVVRSRDAVLLLGTYPLLDPDGFRATNPENVPRLNELIRRLAREEGLAVADHERAFRDFSGLSPDGLHPNDLGYEVMADTWLAAIESLEAATNGR